MPLFEYEQKLTRNPHTLLGLLGIVVVRDEVVSGQRVDGRIQVMANYVRGALVESGGQGHVRSGHYYGSHGQRQANNDAHYCPSQCTLRKAEGKH